MRGEDVMWKKLQGDVFRRPDYAVLLCTACGMGAQIILCLSITLLFLMLGVIYPQGRWWSLYTGASYLIFGGLINGYVTGRMMKYHGANEWRFAASVSSLALPCLLCAVFLIVELVEWFEQAQVKPLSTIFMYFFAWMFVNVPTAYVGANLGFLKHNDKPPCRVSLVLRPIV